ncbi:MAG: sporulation/spore germination protein [Bacillota bacterium]|nr:sporulation/spore germination protein [Bacillota bacterium]
MKKILIVILTFLLFMLSACDTNDNGNLNNSKPEALKINDYFPNTENTKYDYEGEGNEFAYYTVYTDYSKDNRIQTRTNNGGTEVVKVLEIKDGQLMEIFSRPETYFRENFLDKEYEGGNIILKEPLEKGNTWTLKDGSKRTITNVDMEITTPMGTYKTLEVTTEASNYKNVDYYAKDIGLIKTISTGEGYEVSSTLRTIEKDVPLIQNVNVYFPSLEEDTYYYITKEISFKTNDDAKDVIEKMVKDNEDQATVISTNTKLNSLYLNDEENMVYVDFSKEFVSEMNAGSAFEAMILQSITNTLGNYYGVDKVYITLDGKPYESGHILMKEKEPFTVNLEKTKPLS